MASRTANRRRPRRSAPIGRRLKRYVDRIESGVRFVPPVDPPEFSRAPWWPMTLVFNSIKDEDYTASNIIDGIITRLYEAKDAGTGQKAFVFRMQSVRIWGLAKQAISLDIKELIGGSNNLRQFSDLGSGIQFSRLGFRYGTSSRIDPIAYGTTVLFHVSGASSTNKILVYVQILFSSLSGKTPSLTNTSEDHQDYYMVNEASMPRI